MAEHLRALITDRTKTAGPDSPTSGRDESSAPAHYRYRIVVELVYKGRVTRLVFPVSEAQYAVYPVGSIIIIEHTVASLFRRQRWVAPDLGLAGTMVN